MTFYLFYDPNDIAMAYKIVTNTNLITDTWYPTLDKALSIPLNEYRPLQENTTSNQFFFSLFTCLGEFSQIPTRESHPELFL